MVLIVTLMMLIAITIIAVSAMRSSTDKLSISGNFMFRSEAQRAADMAIDRVISATLAAGTQTEVIDVNGDGAADYNVTVTKQCLATAESEGTSAGLKIYDSVWQLTATVSDAATGATVSSARGVSIKGGGACV